MSDNIKIYQLNNNSELDQNSFRHKNEIEVRNT